LRLWRAAKFRNGESRYGNLLSKITAVRAVNEAGGEFSARVLQAGDASFLQN